jgi:fermentation-respiration switch protein FrsA (DUF1100 family)
VAFTRIDRWLVGLGLALLSGAAFILWASGLVVAPPRPKISESGRPTIGVAVDDSSGSLVIRRASGPAREAGLRAGDRIVSVDGIEHPSYDTLMDHVAGRREGDSIKIDARRGPSDDTGVLSDVRVAVHPVSPADFGLPFDEVSFRNSDGLNLKGWYLPAPDGSGRAPAIAWGHGNGTDRRHCLSSAVAVHDAGFAQLLFDFTGRGESDGDVISLGFHEAGDMRAALDFLAGRPGVDPLRLALGGRSMGAVAAIFEAQDDARVKALVLDSPYADLKMEIDEMLAANHVPAFLVSGPLMAVAGWRAHYDPATVKPVEAIRRIKVPILLLHSDQDEVVSYRHAELLKRAAGGPVTFHPLRNAGHNSPRMGDYTTTITNFLTKHLGR